MTEIVARDHDTATEGSASVPWSLYIVRCRDRALYTGIATDVPRRFAEHARDSGRGSKYLRGKGPLTLVYVRAIGSKDLALRVESRIKRLPKAQKEALVEHLLSIDALIDLARTGLSPTNPPSSG